MGAAYLSLRMLSCICASKNGGRWCSSTPGSVGNALDATNGCPSFVIMLKILLLLARPPASRLLRRSIRRPPPGLCRRRLSPAATASGRDSDPATRLRESIVVRSPFSPFCSSSCRSSSWFELFPLYSAAPGVTRPVSAGAVLPPPFPPSPSLPGRLSNGTFQEHSLGAPFSSFPGAPSARRDDAATGGSARLPAASSRGNPVDRLPSSPAPHPGSHRPTSLSPCPSRPFSSSTFCSGSGEGSALRHLANLALLCLLTAAVRQAFRPSSWEADEEEGWSTAAKSGVGGYLM